MNEAKTTTPDEVRSLPVVATLTIPLWDGAPAENEVHVSRTSVTVPVLIKPDLPVLGHVIREHGYSTTETYIVLRDWNEQVLLHEILHVVIGTGPADDPENHRIINAVEVALAPFVRFPDLAKILV